MPISKAQFVELTGENPEDVLGNDWRNELAMMEDVDDEKVEEEELD